MPDWLLQNLVSSIIYAVLILGAGAVFTWLKVKRPVYAPYAIYGLAAMTCVAILIFTITGRPILSRRPPPETTVENAEDNIKKWGNDLGMAVRPLTVSGTAFAYTVTLENGNGVIVARGLKTKPGFIQFQTGLVLSPEHQSAIAKLTKDEADIVTQQVTLELARSRMGYTMAGPDSAHLMQYIALMKGIPVAEVTEESFPRYLDEIDSGISLVRSTTALALARAKQLTPPTMQH